MELSERQKTANGISARRLMNLVGDIEKKVRKKRMKEAVGQGGE